MTPGTWESREGPTHLTDRGFELTSFRSWLRTDPSDAERRELVRRGIHDLTIDKVARRETVTAEGMRRIDTYLVDFKCPDPPSRLQVWVKGEDWEKYCYLDGRFGMAGTMYVVGVLLCAPGGPDGALVLDVAGHYVDPGPGIIRFSRARDFEPISILDPEPPPAYVLRHPA